MGRKTTARNNGEDINMEIIVSEWPGPLLLIYKRDFTLIFF